VLFDAGDGPRNFITTATRHPAARGRAGKKMRVIRVPKLHGALENYARTISRPFVFPP
jgi:hypothetical protein